VSSRPAALDELGAEAAIRDLAERTRHRGLGVELAIDLAYEHGRRTDRYPTELETAMYRISRKPSTTRTNTVVRNEHSSKSKKTTTASA
jgi:signal transduction histidine kinase